MKKIIILLAIITSFTISAAENKDTTFTYKPNFHATIRARAEYSTEHEEYRFQIRNARATIDGRIMPQLDYFINADLSDAGKFKMLDIWARFKDSHGFTIQTGQFRLPFGIDPFRAPHQYFFSNRSFIGKQMCNYRAVGLKLGYQLPKLPLSFDISAFSPTAIGDHSGWQKKAIWAGEAVLKLNTLTVSGGIASVRPSGMRANIIGSCISWRPDRWVVEAEYMYKHYVSKKHAPAHAWNLFGVYRFPIKLGIFNFMSAEARFDGLTGHSNLNPDDHGRLITDDPMRKRITAGMMISHFRSNTAYADIRLDYEKYFYRSGFVPSPEQGDKLTLELVLRF